MCPTSILTNECIQGGPCNLLTVGFCCLHIGLANMVYEGRCVVQFQGQGAVLSHFVKDI